MLGDRVPVFGDECGGKLSIISSPFATGYHYNVRTHIHSVHHVMRVDVNLKSGR